MEIQTESVAELTARQGNLEADLKEAVLAGDYRNMIACQQRLKELEPKLQAVTISETKQTLRKIEKDRAEIADKKKILEDVLKERTADFVKASDAANAARMARQRIEAALYSCDAKDTDLLEARRDLNEKLRNWEKKMIATGLKS